MTGELFAAIDVGSYEMALKVFELSNKNGVRELDYVRHRMDIGNDRTDGLRKWTTPAAALQKQSLTLLF